MNKTTLEKLKKNPHYKISAKQKVTDEDREELLEFGKPEFHNQHVKHDFDKVVPRQRTKDGVLK